MTFKIDRNSVNLPAVAPDDIETPASGHVAQFIGADGLSYVMNSARNVRPASGGGGGGGDVSTVNGKTPDGSGNVELTSSDIPFAPSVTTTQAIANSHAKAEEAESIGSAAHTEAVNAQTAASNSAILAAAAQTTANAANDKANIAMETADNALPISSLTPELLISTLGSAVPGDRLPVEFVDGAAQMLETSSGPSIADPDTGYPINSFDTSTEIYIGALDSSYYTNSPTGSGTVSNEEDSQYGIILVISPSDATPYGIGRDLPETTDGYHAVSFMIKKDEFLTGFQVQLFFKDFSYNTYITLDKSPSPIEVGIWQKLTIPVGGGDGSFGVIDATNVKQLRAIKFRATGAGTKLRIADFKVHEVRSKSVNFFFDDARKDTYTVAYPILKAHGFTGAIAVEHLNVGDSNRCTQAELNQMYADGWTMVGHDTLPFNVSEAEQISKHRAIKNYLATQGFNRGQHIFAWPGGVRTLATEAIGRKFWQVMRPVSSLHNLSVPGVYDPVRPQHQYIGSAVTVAAAKAHLDKISIGGGSIIFTFHSIVETEAAPEDWSIAKFTELVQYAKQLGLIDAKIEQIWQKQKV